MIIGLAAIFFSSSITVDANKTNGQLVYQKKRLIGGSVVTYAITDILRIETRKQWRMESSGTSGNRGVSMPTSACFAIGHRFQGRAGITA